MVHKNQIYVDESDMGKRLDFFLSQNLSDITRSRIKQLIVDNFVTINEVATYPAKKLQQGMIISYSIPKLEESKVNPEIVEFQVILEDEDILVVNKPAGLVVHPGAGNFSGTLVNGLLHHCGESLSGINGIKRPGIVHRLDKGTSGLMIVAKNDKAHQHLSEQFLSRTLKRTYLAICWKIPNPLQGVIKTNIGRSNRNRKKMHILSRGGKQAITHYSLIEKLGSYTSLIQCKLETGRTHQIRVHLTHIGNNLVGDPTYGKNPRGLPSEINQIANNLILKERPLLHAAKLRFLHPSNDKLIKLKIDPPEDFIKMQDSFKNDFNFLCNPSKS